MKISKFHFEYFKRCFLNITNCFVRFSNEIFIFEKLLLPYLNLYICLLPLQWTQLKQMAKPNRPMNRKKNRLWSRDIDKFPTNYFGVTLKLHTNTDNLRCSFKNMQTKIKTIKKKLLLIHKNSDFIQIKYNFYNK